MMQLACELAQDTPALVALPDLRSLLFATYANPLSIFTLGGLAFTECH